MPHDTLLLIGRETAGATTGFQTRAHRLRARGVADEVLLLTDDANPRRTLAAVHTWLGEQATTTVDTDYPATAD